MTCSICLDDAKHPSSLECSHTFCFHCILSWVASQAGSRFKCPCCRKAIIKVCVGDKTFDMKSFQLLFNAYTYLFIDHAEFPAKTVVLDEIITSLAKFNDPGFICTMMMMCVLRGEL